MCICRLAIQSESLSRLCGATQGGRQMIMIPDEEVKVKEDRIIYLPSSSFIGRV